MKVIKSNLWKWRGKEQRMFKPIKRDVGIDELDRKIKDLEHTLEKARREKEP